MDTALTARQLTLSYDRAAIIRDLHVEIPVRQITVLVGANGCGKSTLLKGLSRLLKPMSGAVYLNGLAIAKLPTKAVAQQLGLLPQGPTAPEGLTVRELVAQGRYPHQSWFQQWSAEDERLVEEALSITDMTDLGDRSLDSLSGGQRQRAWIAMALAQHTETLLLDEPTTFLDLAHQVEVLDLLHELNQVQKRTIVMVLHDLNQACRYADHLVVMRQGAIFAQGAPAEVMTEDIVREVFGLESRIISDPVSGTPLCIPISPKMRMKQERT
ncbi:ABC transporter ATP-binding protein [Leptolyngbya sp. O-77]|uniref:ABC transporter ATP-binding protein n=1 Tax=Leptolyngbya sp. O-77 TaxID=1080068 RepID=UPI00074D3525|nr:ABC transporter ATP-binding protein [Leptolyngbya sp. O-77]BAU40265.1 putative siderophore transport system ATP-binding protein YusV [Leptolyngbya sp. O-77]